MLGPKFFNKIAMKIRRVDISIFKNWVKLFLLEKKTIIALANNIEDKKFVKH